ncbi:EamA family transporter [Leptolyngbya sp. FACHB-541]|uniref:EamA family transporter n=1 Tax=Leptolyngbya sp. FACHB-541 TaxID=2692810 RepID=UPI00168624C6|nr:EamA family transporter [Leptolyngbya sp. FACHB-541]MBD1998146.1 EamA family transporter [Leptolyngbya sp. FACHB-541]
MGRLDNLPENSGAADPNAAQDILNTVTQDLRQLQQELVSQLHQDVQRLQAEKARLQGDIDSLQSQQQVALSQQQRAQQQLWAKQLAQALAQHLQGALVQRMEQTNLPQRVGTNLPAAPASNSHHENAYRLLASLDATLNRTLTSLRQDLTSYQSSLSQQISRMHNLEQQGEAILEALVSRLSQQLQAEIIREQTGGFQPPPGGVGSNGDHRPPFGEQFAQGNGTQGNGTSATGYPHANSRLPSEVMQPPRQRPPSVLPVAPSTAPDPAIAPMRLTSPMGLSQFQVGLALILLSTIALSLHNVVVGVIGNPTSVLGSFELGGFLKLGLGNALLILLLRMMIVVPLMIWMAQRLYPSVWQDIKNFLTSNDRRLLMTVIGSGGCLFLSQVLIYIAIAEIGPGVAVTILFMYPLITVPLAWLFFGDRPTLLRWVVMLVISIGIVLAALPRITQTSSVSGAGVAIAVGSGIAFACYLISMQICFRKLHPVPVSLAQFLTIGFLAAVSLIFLPALPLPDRWSAQVSIDQPLGFAIGGIFLGVLTLVGYLSNNFGVRFLGAARTSIIASTGPVLTALLAFLLTPGPFTQLQVVQWLGIIVVTFGVIALSFERMSTAQAKSVRPVKG